MRLAFLDRLGRAIYVSWFKETKIEKEASKIIINAPSAHAKDTISLRFTDDIEKAIALSLEDYTVELRQMA